MGTIRADILQVTLLLSQLICCPSYKVSASKGFWAMFCTYSIALDRCFSGTIQFKHISLRFKEAAGDDQRLPNLDIKYNGLKSFIAINYTMFLSSLCPSSSWVVFPLFILKLVKFLAGELNHFSLLFSSCLFTTDTIWSDWVSWDRLHRENKDICQWIVLKFNETRDNNGEETIVYL